MSVARINAFQLAAATLIGAAAVVIGLQSVERDSARRDVERSAAVLANAVTQRLNGALIALTRSVELTVAQGGIAAGLGAQAALDRWSRARPAYSAVFVVSPAGRVVAASPSRLVGQDLSYESWLEGARNGTTVADAAGWGSAAAGRAAESVVAAPIRDGGGALQGIVVVALGERWFAETTGEAKRAVAIEDGAATLTVLGSGGGVIYRSGSGVAETSGEAAEVTARMSGTDAATGWTTIVRVPQGAAGGLVAVPWMLVQAALAAAAAMALIGWWLGRGADRQLAGIGRDDVTADADGKAGVFSGLASRVAALREREAQAARTSRDSRAAFLRIRERLHAFELLSGWTYWSIDLAQGNATWSHRASGAETTSERTMGLDAVTAYVVPEDRELLRLTLHAASEGNGAHDIELRLAGGGREGQRLLVRMERAGDAAGRGQVLHALTRETVRGAVGEAHAARDAIAAERRRDTSMLRPVVDSVVVDFNDVLTLAIANLDALRDTASDRVPLERAMRALWRGAGLTRRMVAFVRQQIPALHKAVVPEVVQGLRPFLAASLPPHVPFAVDLAEGLPPVRCSDRQLELVIMNLVLHAHATAPLGSRIRLGAEEAGSQVRITVGTEPSLLARAAAEPAAPAEGRAIESGMAAVRTLVAQAHGDLVQSEQDGRPIYELLLPAGEHEAARPAPPTEAAGSARVLLVNGDALMRATLSDTLRDLGHLVEETRSGADALARLGKASFDVLVADQNLPVMSGLQLAATASRMTPGLKIVVTSARGQLPRSAEAFLLLDKPFGRAELAHVLSLPMPARAVADAA